MRITKIQTKGTSWKTISDDRIMEIIKDANDYNGDIQYVMLFFTAVDENMPRRRTSSRGLTK